MNVLLPITVPGFSCLASGAVNAISENFTKRPNAAYKKIEQIYVDSFAEGFREVSADTNHLANTNSRQALKGFESKPLTRLGLESFAHVFSSALAVGSFFVCNRQLMEQASKSDDMLLPQQQKEILESNQRLNRRQLFHFAGAAALNSGISLAFDERERAIANAIQRLSENPQALEKIAIIAKQDGKAIAESNNQERRSKNREQMRAILFEEKRNPSVRMPSPYVFQPVPSPLRGSISTLANLLAGYMVTTSSTF